MLKKGVSLNGLIQSNIIYMTRQSLRDINETLFHGISILKKAILWWPYWIQGIW